MYLGLLVIAIGTVFQNFLHKSIVAGCGRFVQRRSFDGFLEVTQENMKTTYTE